MPGILPNSVVPSGKAAEAPRGQGIEGGELSGRLAGRTLWRQVAMLAVWLLLEQLLNFMVGTVDLTLAGHLRPLALRVPAVDALGVGGYFMWLMGLFFAAVDVGASALVARAIGGRHRGLANAAVGQAMIIGAITGLAMGTALFVGAHFVCHLVGLRGEALTLGTQYVRILSVTAPMSAILFISAACLRGAGDTRSPFWVMVVVNIVNVGMSCAFVFAPAPLGGHGVAGIALGTAIAWTLGAIMIVGVLVRGSEGLRLHWHRLRPHLHTIWRIVRVGLPNLGESLGQWGGNFIILMIVGHLAIHGLAVHGAIGAHAIAIRIESVSFLMGFALGIAAATLAGQYLGAGRPDKAKHAMMICWAAGAGLMILMGLVFIFAPRPLVWLISDAPLHLKLVPPLLRIAGVIQIAFGTYIVLSKGLRGAGDTRMTMVLTYASTFLVRLPAAWVLGVWMGWGLTGVWLGLCGELVVRACLFMGRFFQGGWTRVRV